MDDLLNRLIDQLDTLIPFLDIAQEDVFKLIQDNHLIWFPESEIDLPDSYETYRTQITYSAFLLGYSYFEAFLADLVRKIYSHNQNMLPRDKKLNFSEIVEAENYETIIRMMIDKEIISLFYKSMESVIAYFRRKLCLPWSDEHKKQFIVASLTRNCIIHNMSIVDQKLANKSDYKVGERINLSDNDVHDYGLLVREFAPDLYQEAKSRYFSSA